MMVNWVYRRRVSGASKRIFATMKSTIDAVKFSNTIQLSSFYCNHILPHYWQEYSWYFSRGIDTVKITALSNHKTIILNNYIRMFYDIVLIKTSIQHYAILDILCVPFVCIAPKTLNYLSYQSFDLECPDEGYSRNTSCSLILISTCLIIILFMTWLFIFVFRASVIILQPIKCYTQRTLFNSYDKLLVVAFCVFVLFIQCTLYCKFLWIVLFFIAPSVFSNVYLYRYLYVIIMSSLFFFSL